MPESLNRRVLLLGWGAADWGIIEPLLAAGRLPNLERLIEHGTHGPLSTLTPLVRSMLWTSLSTGKLPEKHQIFSDVEPQPDGHGTRLCASTSRATKALWNILSQCGIGCHSIGFPCSYPAERIRGVSVSDVAIAVGTAPRLREQMLKAAVHPEALTDDVMALCQPPRDLLPEQILDFIPNAAQIDQRKDRRLARFAHHLSNMLSVHNVSTWVMETQPWQFMVVYQSAIELVSEEFMAFHPPQRDGVSDDEYQMYKDVVARVYGFHDVMLGRLLELAGPDTAVIVCSERGWVPGHGLGGRAKSRDRIQRAWRDGMLVMAGDGVRRQGRVRGITVLDVAPTVLRLFGLPVANDLDGRPIDAALESPRHADAIESWDDVPGDSGMAERGGGVQPTDSAHTIAHLLEMGYEEPVDTRAAQKAARASEQSDFNRALVLLTTGHYQRAVDLLTPLWQSKNDFRQGYFLALAHLFRRDHAASQRVIDEILSHAKSVGERRVKRVSRFRSFVAEIAPQRIAEAESGNHPRNIDDPETARKRIERTEKTLAAIEDKLRQFDPNGVPRLMLLQAAIAIAEKRFAEAAKLLYDVEAVSSKSAAQMLQVGNAFIRLRRWEDAARVLERSLELDANNALAHNGFAAALMRLRQVDRAMEHLFTSAELLPDNPYTHFLVGVGFSRLGDPKRAEDALLAAINLSPGFLLARRVLVRVYQHQLNRADLAAQQQLSIAMLREKRRTHAKTRPAEVA